MSFIKQNTMRFKILLTLMIIFSNNSCENIMEGKYAITFQNHSTKNVMIVEGMNRRGFEYYPDTTLPANKPLLQQIAPNEHGDILSSNKWADVMNSIPSDTLSIYVFDPDTINAYDWSIIKSDYKVLKRYDLSVHDLEETKWVVNYP
jgi:hypothetical protein